MSFATDQLYRIFSQHTVYRECVECYRVHNGQDKRCQSCQGSECGSMNPNLKGSNVKKVKIYN